MSWLGTLSGLPMPSSWGTRTSWSPPQQTKLPGCGRLMASPTSARCAPDNPLLLNCCQILSADGRINHFCRVYITITCVRQHIKSQMFAEVSCLSTKIERCLCIYRTCCMSFGDPGIALSPALADRNIVQANEIFKPASMLLFY